MAFKPSKKGKGNGISDLMDNSVQAATIVLSLVQQAAQYAPMPYLQQAAKTTLTIMQIIQSMKENKADFRRLGHTCTSIIAAVWESYQRSPNKEHWPPRELSEVIRQLVETLDDIHEFLEEQVKRPRAIRFIHNVTDRAKIKEYREALEDAIAKFEVSSHLNINDAVYQLLRENKEIREMLENQKSDATKLLEKVEQDSERLRQERIEEERLEEERRKRREREHEAEEKRRAEEARREEEKKNEVALQDLLRREEEDALKAAEAHKVQQAIEEQRRRQAEFEELKRAKAREEDSRASESTADSEARLEAILAEIALLKAKKSEQGRRPKKGRRASADSEDEERTEADEEDYEQYDEYEDDDSIQTRKGKAKAKLNGRRKPEPPSPQPSPRPIPSPAEQFQPQQDLSAQFSQMGIGYPPALGTAYPSSPPFSPPYPYYSPHPYPSPGFSPQMGYPLGPSPYGSPPQVSNLNSGNVSYSTVSNIGNDYSKNYGAGARRAKRR